MKGQAFVGAPFAASDITTVTNDVLVSDLLWRATNLVEDCFKNLNYSWWRTVAVCGGQVQVVYPPQRSGSSSAASIHRVDSFRVRKNPVTIHINRFTLNLNECVTRLSRLMLRSMLIRSARRTESRVERKPGEGPCVKA